MAKQSIVILTSTAGQLNVTSEAIKAAGYFGYSRGIHTVCWYLNDFVGRMYVEATLATNPTENDWFPINLNGMNPYVQYPVDPNNPSGPKGGDSGVFTYTFQANLTFVRLRVDRSYLTNPNIWDLGVLTKALLNY